MKITSDFNKVDMDLIMHGWFSEACDAFPGQAFSLKVKKVLFDEKSEFQHMLVFESETYGRVLVLDGHIQLTERDEAYYQEMIANISLNVHPNPRRVLIIGGGDGGVAREVARHPCVEHIDLVEIDPLVLKVARNYLPFTACGLDHPKVTVHTADGASFLRERLTSGQKYDVIITDSTDPGGLATPLFTKEYFQSLHQSLTDNGIICNQGETMLLEVPMIQKLLSFCREIFPVVGYAYNIMPTYPCGHIGYVIASKSKDTDLREAIRDAPAECTFYTKALHKAAFVLPKCYERAFGSNPTA
uniref:Spermidine synthase n=2 Tax=Mesocestoides corti TaxID=53468 RepID=A0A5K3EEZ7_MESCO